MENVIKDNLEKHIRSNSLLGGQANQKQFSPWQPYCMSDWNKIFLRNFNGPIDCCQEDFFIFQPIRNYSIGYIECQIGPKYGISFEVYLLIIPACFGFKWPNVFLKYFFSNYNPTDVFDGSCIILLTTFQLKRCSGFQRDDWEN